MEYMYIYGIKWDIMGNESKSPVEIYQYDLWETHPASSKMGRITLPMTATYYLSILDLR
jgi:hypothetical protein